MAAFLFFLSFVFGALAVHPFVTFPASLIFLKRFRSRAILPVADAHPQTYAICMCAYNEEGVIKDKAENLLALKRALPGLEVRIYVDAASDRTAEFLKPYKGEFFIHVSEDRHGKTYGMNLLVSGASSSVVVFTDANVMLDADTIQNLEKYFADPSVGCVCGHLKYTNADSGATAATGSLYWKLEEFIKQAESDTGSVMGADGSIFAIRRSLHNPPPADIIDDMYVSFSILCDGYRVVRAPDVVAYEESVTASHEEFKRKVRIACQAFNVHRLLWPRLRQLGGVDLYKYISHKLLRWFTLLWIGLSLLFFGLSLFSAGWGLLFVLMAVMAVAGIYLGLKKNITPVPQLADIFSSFGGTLLGVFKSLGGERFQTWTPAQSIRKSS